MAEQKPNDPIRIDKGMTLDLLKDTGPSLSATSDVPVIETTPDVVVAKPESAPAAADTEQGAELEEQSDAPDTAVEAKPADAAAQPEAKKPPRGVQKRIDELTRQREDEKRSADSLQGMLDRELQARTAKPAEAQPAAQEAEEAPQMPLRAQYTDAEGYAQALAEWAPAQAAFAAKREAKAVIDQERRDAHNRNVAAAQAQAREAYQGRVDKIVAELPDYHEVAESPDVQVSIPMAHAILSSEHGPRMQYYLGKNPEEAKRISALNPALQLVEMGQIVAKVTAGAAAAPAPAAAAAAPAPAAKPVSAAPKPIAPLATGGETRTPSGEEESMDAYAARRKKELAAERRPGARLN